MKRNLTRLSRGYTTALDKYLEQVPLASLQPGRGLGHQAVVIGLETLDVAKIHEAALASLEASGRRDELQFRIRCHQRATVQEAILANLAK